MTNENNNLDAIYQKLSLWLDDIKNHEISSMVDFIEQAKKYLLAAEALPEEKVTQFVNNLAYDFAEFYQQSKTEAQHSIYLGLLAENFWSELAKITDKSQVEWIELMADFNHHGDYQQDDIVGFGILICKSCQEKIEYFHQSKVIACPNCQATHFFRQGLAP
jgi:zinc ribbon family protein